MSNADSGLMGRNEYARHRRCSPGAVTFASKDRIRDACIFDGDRIVGIRWSQADELWALNTDPGAAEKTGVVSQVPPSFGSAAGDLGLPGPAPAGESDRLDYLEHRALTEKFRGKSAELEYLERLGLLVSAAEVREANFRRYRTLRDKMLNIPDRISTIVAAERDPSRIHQLLTQELKRVLSDLAADATAETVSEAADD